MTPPGRIGGKTPERLVKLVTDAVKRSSQSAVARESGVALLTIQRCLKGKGEPSSATLAKLADYFWTTEEFLRGRDRLPYNRVREFLSPVIFAAGKEIVSREIGIPLNDIIEYHKGEKYPENQDTLERLAGYLNAPIEIFKAKGWDEFIENLRFSLGTVISKKGFKASEEKTGIPASILFLSILREIEPSDTFFIKLSESYNVTVEWLRGEQILDDESKIALEKMHYSIERLKEYLSRENQLIEFVDTIETSANIITQALSSSKLEHAKMKDRTWKILDTVPKEAFSEMFEKISKNLTDKKK